MWVNFNQEANMGKKHLTITEVAKRIQKSISFVNTIIDREELKYVTKPTRSGRTARVVIPLEEVEQFMRDYGIIKKGTIKRVEMHADKLAWGLIRPEFGKIGQDIRFFDVALKAGYEPKEGDVVEYEIDYQRKTEREEYKHRQAFKVVPLSVPL